MTTATDSANGRARFALASIGWSAPNNARVWNRLGGGKDHVEADRDFIDQLPDPDLLRDIAHDQRGFRTRAIRHVLEQGITDFLDLGAGLPDSLPDRESENVSDLARRHSPNARTLYVDHDRYVARHLECAISPEGVRAVCADVRDTVTVLTQATLWLDLTAPIGVVLVGLLDYLTDDDAGPVLAELSRTLARGSYVMLSWAHADLAPVAVAWNAKDTPLSMHPRDENDMRGLLPDRLRVLPPGLVPCSRWGVDIGPASPVPQYAMLAQLD
jgi:S-adenosyl methyltransferase